MYPMLANVVPGRGTANLTSTLLSGKLSEIFRSGVVDLSFGLYGYSSRIRILDPPQESSCAK